MVIGRLKLSEQLPQALYDFYHMHATSPPSLPSTLCDVLPIELQLSARPRPLKRGDRLFVQRAKPTQMFYIADAEVVLQRPGLQGENVVLQRVRQGFVAEASLQSTSYHCDALVTSAGAAITIPIAPLRQALGSDLDFAARWISMLNNEVRRLRTQCERLSLVGIHERVLHLIDTEGKHGRLVLNASIKSMAAEIGVTHEALYRTLASMEKRGQLQRADGTLRICKPAAH